MVAQTAIAAGPRQPDPQVTEREARSLSGLRMLVLGIATSIFALAGLTPVVPGRARVVQLFGRYRGTIRDSGLQWINPFTRRIAVYSVDDYTQFVTIQAETAVRHIASSYPYTAPGDGELSLRDNVPPMMTATESQ
jgi:hypothetical protein